MKAQEKQAVMQAFKQGELQLLVATTVIEVGVDVPNASLMIIENPERLGLAQLHQLRGRVGRGAVASHCVLLYKTPLSKTAQTRLQVLRDSNDGFVIAQRDLEIRGPGELLGTRQTGSAEFKVADLLRDQAMIPEVQRVARHLHQHYPEHAQALIERWLPEKARYPTHKRAPQAPFRDDPRYHPPPGTPAAADTTSMTMALAISIKNAPTIGTTKNATCDGRNDR